MIFEVLVRKYLLDHQASLSLYPLAFIFPSDKIGNGAVYLSFDSPLSFSSPEVLYVLEY